MFFGAKTTNPPNASKLKTDFLRCAVQQGAPCKVQTGMKKTRWVTSGFHRSLDLWSYRRPQTACDESNCCGCPSPPYKEAAAVLAGAQRVGLTKLDLVSSEGFTH